METSVYQWTIEQLVEAIRNRLIERRYGTSEFQIVFKVNGLDYVTSLYVLSIEDDWYSAPDGGRINTIVALVATRSQREVTMLARLSKKGRDRKHLIAAVAETMFKGLWAYDTQSLLTNELVSRIEARKKGTAMLYRRDVSPDSGPNALYAAWEYPHLYKVLHIDHQAIHGNGNWPTPGFMDARWIASPMLTIDSTPMLCRRGYHASVCIRDIFTRWFPTYSGEQFDHRPLEVRFKAMSPVYFLETNDRVFIGDREGKVVLKSARLTERIDLERLEAYGLGDECAERLILLLDDLMHEVRRGSYGRPYGTVDIDITTLVNRREDIEKPEGWHHFADPFDLFLNEINFTPLYLPYGRLIDAVINTIQAVNAVQRARSSKPIRYAITATVLAMLVEAKIEWPDLDGGLLRSSRGIKEDWNYYVQSVNDDPDLKRDLAVFWSQFNLNFSYIGFIYDYDRELWVMQLRG